MRKALKIGIWMLSVVTMLFTACVDDDLPEEDGTDVTANGEEPTGDVYIRFSLRLGDGMTSRADATTGATGETTGGTDPIVPTDPVDPIIPPETPGTNNENAIHTVDILVFDADGKLWDIVYLDAEQVALATDPANTEGVTVPIMGEKGETMHIYAAVNMPSRMRDKLIIGCGLDVSYRSDGVDYWDVMNDFIPGSNGKQEMLGTEFGIPMTGQFKINANNASDIPIDGKHSTKENALSVTADLTRMVAKVHLLARSISYTPAGQTEPVEYVYAADNSAVAIAEGTTTQETTDFSNWIGWMLLDDVRYMVNGINRSTYIFPQYIFPQTDAETDKPKDLNMNLAYYRSGNTFDETKWGTEFTRYRNFDLHKYNVSQSEYFGQAEKYDATRLDKKVMGTENATRYVKGLYCPENYFDKPEDMAFYTGQKNAIPMVTHLSIAAKLVPRDLVVLTDFPDKLDEFFKEAKERKGNTEFYKKYNVTEEQLDAAHIDLDEDAKLWSEGTEKVMGMKEYYFTGAKPAAVIKRKEFYLFSARNIREANCFINWSLIARGLWTDDINDFDSAKWPANTYYVYDTQYDEVSSVADEDAWGRRYVYLVAGAVTYASDENIGVKLHSVPHVSGWGYYYSYIDNDGSTTYGVTPFTASQVTRNTYYIITVENFGSPGGTITDPEYIRVNTEPVSWDYAGRGDINLH